MEIIRIEDFIRLCTVREQMAYRDIAGKAVSDPYGGNQIKSQKRKVCQIILGKRFGIQMSMNKPESSQSFSAKWKVLQVGNE